MSRVIYFDANSTTPICKEAETIRAKYSASLNPASDTKLTKPLTNLISQAESGIKKHLAINDDYYVIFTSGGSESNCTIYRSVVEAYNRVVGKQPHIITTAIEHHSTMMCLNALVESKYCTVSYLKPDIYGRITAAQIQKHIKDNTNVALVAVIFANNELGTINDISEIGAVCAEHKIPLHTDAVQIFGKWKLNLPELGVVSLSASFHKFYGPKSLGLLVIKKHLVDGYQLRGIISGSQQHGLRGGTQDAALIASGYKALECAFKGRKKKNDFLHRLKCELIELLNKKFVILKDAADYKEPLPIKNKAKTCYLVLLGPDYTDQSQVMCNTLMIAIVPFGADKFCNVKFKQALMAKDIYVSITSACLTSSVKASHVLYALGLDEKIRTGVIRISFSDNNKLGEIKKFASVFNELLTKQYQSCLKS